MQKIITKLRAYARLMRLDKPIGIYLLLWPTLIALWLAGNGRPDGKLIIIFSLGVIVMRSAGCVINDFADRKIDGLVARTKVRPLITGEVTSFEALTIFFSLVIFAFALVLFTNKMTIMLSTVALFLATLYPFTKRFTYFPQVFLGAAFAWSIPMAFAAQSQALPLTCWLLYIATLIWALAYDTLYAMADREEDIRANIKSIAIILGKYDSVVVGLSHSVMFLIYAWIGYLISASMPYYLFILMAGLIAIYQQWLIRNKDRQACFEAFLNNHWIGLVLFLAVAYANASFPFF